MPDDNGLTDPTHEKNAWWQLNCFYRWSYQIRETMLSHLKIYAYMRRWDDYVKMRMLMRQCGVSRTPGCSWIDIGDRRSCSWISWWWQLTSLFGEHIPIAEWGDEERRLHSNYRLHMEPEKLKSWFKKYCFKKIYWGNMFFYFLHLIFYIITLK
jgi:hypothetical protein